MTSLVPHSGIPYDLDGDGLFELEKLYRCPSTPWLRLNFVASVNGDAVGFDGTSESLSSRTDRKILGAIRRNADLVLVGANSVRKEGYFLPKTVPLAILTGSGDLTGHRIPSVVPAGRVLIVCPPAAASKARESLAADNVEIVEIRPDASNTTSAQSLNITMAISALRGRSYSNIVCEGGMTLAGSLLRSGLVDEVCLTTSPQITATHQPILSDAAKDHRLTLKQLLVDEDGFLYARWLVSR